MAVDHLPQAAMVNVGAGIPMYDVPEAARRKGREDLYFTIEHGPMGGWPQVGGVSRNPDAILGQLEVFQFYEGGGPDVSVLSFGQIDGRGNVNVSRFGAMRPGCGGFPNIAHGVRRLILCGSITTGGAESRVDRGRLEILQEGRIRRFVSQLDEITFDAPRALAAGHRITVLTERAIFEVEESGLVLTAIAPGVDLQRDVLAHIEFPIQVAPEPSIIDPAYFGADPL
jgi:acyl CoA:acetate/3-ketoacid CoA transferase